MRVLVLTGGNTPERQPSLENGTFAAELLASYDDLTVTQVDLRLDDEASKQAVISANPDIVFNAQIGGEGEDGSVQAFLFEHGLKYTHSNTLTSMLAFNKAITKRLAGDVCGIPVLPTYFVGRRDRVLDAVDRISFPCVVKPVANGSSIGVLLCHSPADLTHEALTAAGHADELVIVEKMADTNRNFTVGVLGDAVMAVAELVVANHPFYSYEAKIDWWASIVHAPADIPAELAGEMRRYAKIAHDSLGCHGISRSDFMIDDGKVYFLEINTQPVLNDRSLYTDEAGREIHDTRSFVRAVLDLAAERQAKLETPK